MKHRPFFIALLALFLQSGAAFAADLVKTDTVVGTGTEATGGTNVVVNYTGWLHDAKKKDLRGEKFDSSVGRGPFSFHIESIAGFPHFAFVCVSSIKFDGL